MNSKIIDDEIVELTEEEKKIQKEKAKKLIDNVSQELINRFILRIKGKVNV